MGRVSWRMRDSLSGQQLPADLLTWLNPISDTCVRVKVRLCVWRETGASEGRSWREGEATPWKPLQQNKMEFVSTLPKLCMSPSVSLTKLVPILCLSLPF